MIFWPLALSAKTLGKQIPRAIIEQLVQELSHGQSARLCDKNGVPMGKWHRVSDPIQHVRHRTNRSGIPPEEVVDERSAIYQEYVYFHNFVQRFLYDEGDALNRDDATATPLHLFACTGIPKVTVEIIGHKQFHAELDVERLNLYLFDAGIAMLALQVGTSSEPMVIENATGQRRSMTLADTLDFTDYFRRCYVPFWNGKAPGLFPQSVTWGYGARMIAPAPEQGLHSLPLTELAGTGQRISPRYEPIVDWWAQLLPNPILIEGPGLAKLPSTTVPVTWTQVVDERLPSMTYLAVDNPLEISDGDWQRICFADGAGGAPFTYSAKFLRDFEQQHCYDRFWYNDPLVDPDTAEPSRYLFSGYHFATVGPATSRSGTSPSFFRRYIADHFERHYYQMGLICHFQHAALLSFSDRMSHAVAHLDPEERRDDFREQMKAIERDRLRFTHTYWFTGISTQIQAKEMYQLWREQLGVQKLFDEVSEEARSASNWLETQAQIDLAQTQTAIARASERLGMIAAGAAALGLPMAFFGMNILIQPLCGTGDKGSWGCRPEWVLYGVFTAASLALFRVLYKWSRRGDRK